MSIHERIRERRKELKLTLCEFADLVGVTQQAASKWETRDNNPRSKRLMQIAKALDTTVEWLVGGEGKVVYVNQAPSDEVLMLRKACKSAVLALGHASQRNPLYEDSYKEMSQVVVAIFKAEQSEKSK